MQMGTEQPLPPSPPADGLGGSHLPVGLLGLEFAFLYPSPHTELAYWLLISAYKTKVPSCPHPPIGRIASGKELQCQGRPHNSGSSHVGLCPEERNWGGYALELEVCDR